METKNITDDHNQSTSKGAIGTKLRAKERHRSQASPTNNTDINDPENLDYEDIDDNHQPIHFDDGHGSKETPNEPVKLQNNDTKTPNEEGKSVEKQQEIVDNDSSSIKDNPTAESDEGELDEADLEDGEIHDPSASKTRTSTSTDPLLEQNRNQINTNVPSSPEAKVHCRFFLQGRCHWGPNCKYVHPSNDAMKGSSGPPIDGALSANHEGTSPTSAGLSLPKPPTPTANSWISPQATTVTSQFFPNPVLRVPAPHSAIPLVIPPAGTESAWERGLRSAKTLREQSMRRKQLDKDFNEKKFNLTIRDALDERDTDDNLLNTNRSSSTDYDQGNLHGSSYGDTRAGYSDRYRSYMYSGTQSNARHQNHVRPRSNLPVNDHSDRRTRHSDDYNDNRNRKENASSKHSKLPSKKDDTTSYKRNSSQQQYSSGSHHNNDVQSHSNSYGIRRGDDWHDPWDRSRNHGNNVRRLSGGGRERSYSSSSSASSSSSSRSSHSRSHSTSSSSRSRSRSRSRPKRRSPSVTRAKRSTPTAKSSETVKNGNEKKSNSNKKLASPSSTATTNKFLPGRQISSHTLKKAEKSSISSNSTSNNHSKDTHGRDSDVNLKKRTKKEKNSRSDSTSSSSSSDSDIDRLKHRSSSSSSDSSSSENETRSPLKAKSASASGGKSTASSHSTKSVNRQISSSSTGGKTSKSKNDSSNRESPSTSAKKRRDTSSSTGSTSAAKKTKFNQDSHKSSTDANNTEISDACKKKDKQQLLKELQEAEKIVMQRSAKASS